MIKVLGAKILALWVHKKNQKWIKNPHQAQETVFQNLLKKGKKTLFGKDHQLNLVNNLESFKQRIPIRDYEGLRPYIEKVLKGEDAVQEDIK